MLSSRAAVKVPRSENAVPRPPRSRALPTPENDLSSYRLRALIILVALAFVALLGRLWYLQILHGEAQKTQAETNRRRRVRDTAPRGVIVDVKGRTLAMNDAQFTIYVDPGGLPKSRDDKEAVYQQLAKILDITRSDLEKILIKNRVGLNPVAVAQGVTQQVLARVEENRMMIPGVYADVEPVRRYPNGVLASHVLGHIGPITEKEFADPEIKKRNYRQNDSMGKDGLERSYDALLCGLPGGVFYEIDAKGRRQREMGREDPIPGATLRLNLNREVQQAAQEMLNGKHGAAVAIDPRDGGVIAMASAPDFDPNLMVKRPLKQEIYDTQVKPGQLNRAVQSAFPPGSTFKIVTSAAGLSEGAITPNTYMFCSGGMRIGRRLFGCHNHHGDVSLTNALAASCDVYYYHVGLAVKADKIADWAEKFGMGQKSGIDIPGERAGFIPSPDKYRESAEKRGDADTRWYPGMTANMSIGQGQIQVTPLQMAQAVGAIANGGTVYEPHLVKDAIGADGKIVYEAKPKPIHTLGLSPRNISAIQDGLRAAVSGSRGTAHSAALPGVAVAGKTGSAELHGGAKKASHGWFICYAPYEKPTIAICVMLESTGSENYHGGMNAAPVARKMLSAYFKVGDAAAGTGSAVD